MHTHHTLARITHPATSEATKLALRKLKGTYPKLKEEKGIDFHFLSRSRFTVPMMLELGMPPHEIITERLKHKEGLTKLIHEITNFAHLSIPAYSKLNFRALVRHKIPLRVLLEHHVSLGLLILEGFENKELIRAGASESQINSLRESHAKAPIVFGLKKRPQKN